MTCPVEMVDYTSSLIAADWYEENGQQRIADQIRYRADVPRIYVLSICIWLHISISGHNNSRKRGSSSTARKCGTYWVKYSVSGRKRVSVMFSHSSSRRSSLLWMDDLTSP